MIVLQRLMRRPVERHWTSLLGPPAVGCVVILVAASAFLAVSAAQIPAPDALLPRRLQRWAYLALSILLLVQLVTTWFGGQNRRPRRVLWVLLCGATGTALVGSGIDGAPDAVRDLGVLAVLLGFLVARAVVYRRMPGPRRTGAGRSRLDSAGISARRTFPIALMLAVLSGGVIVLAATTLVIAPGWATRTLVTNPLWLTIAVLAAAVVVFPAAEDWIRGDRRLHVVRQHPATMPTRTVLGSVAVAVTLAVVTTATILAQNSLP